VLSYSRHVRTQHERDGRILMVNHRVARVPISFLVSALALLVAGCAEEPSSAPTLITIDSDQVTWESTEGALWGIADVLEMDGMIWVLSPVEPFVHGLRYGAEMVAFGTQGHGPGEFRSARALLPSGEVGEITIWDAASRLYRTFSHEGLPVSTREAGALGTVRGDIDVVTFGDPLRRATTANGSIVKAEFAGAVMWGSDLWTATLVRTTAHGDVERLVDFGDLHGAFHEEVRTRSVLVPVPLWDACPDGTVVVLDPMARFLYRIDSTWEERDSLFVPWDVPPLTRADRISYLKGQMKPSCRGNVLRPAIWKRCWHEPRKEAGTGSRRRPRSPLISSAPRAGCGCRNTMAHPIRWASPRRGARSPSRATRTPTRK